jgi:hypothetical protein
MLPSPAWGNAATVTPTAPGLSRVTGGEYGDTNQVFCSGYAVLPGGDAEVFLSDGSTAYSDAGEIQWIKKHSVKVFGKEFRIRTQYQVYSPPAQSVPTYSPPVPPVTQPLSSFGGNIPLAPANESGN